MLILNEVFHVRIDNKLFETFKDGKISRQLGQGRLLRWQELFLKFDFTVEWKKGTDNSLADMLTREGAM